MTTTAETAPAGTLDAAGLVAELRASFDRGTPAPKPGVGASSAA